MADVPFRVPQKVNYFSYLPTSRSSITPDTVSCTRGYPCQELELDFLSVVRHNV